MCFKSAELASYKQAVAERAKKKMEEAKLKKIEEKKKAKKAIQKMRDIENKKKIAEEEKMIRIRIKMSMKGK